MKIGKYFTLSELTHTNSGLDNSPNADEIQNLKTLVKEVLDPLREMYGKGISVNSGYRSPLVNRSVKGSTTSDHLGGYAADITGGSPEENEKLFNLIKDNFKFKQLINEYDFKWVHVSYKEGYNKGQILKMG